MARSNLIQRSIAIGGRRRRIGLEPDFWAALSEIGATVVLSEDELVTFIADREPDVAPASAVRVFVTSYYVAVSEAARQLC